MTPMELLVRSERRLTSVMKQRDAALTDRANMELKLEEARKFGEEAAEKYNRVTATSTLRCAFCDEMYAEGTLATRNEALTAHVLVCPKHPIRKFKKALQRISDARSHTGVICDSCKSPVVNRAPHLYDIADVALEDQDGEV